MKNHIKNLSGINNILLTSVIIISLPFLYPLTQIEPKYFNIETLLFTIGNIFGFIGLVFLLFNVLIGNRRLVKVFTSNLIEVNRFHKFLGTYGTLFVFLHPLLEMYSYGENLLFVLIPNLSTAFETYISLGRFALILFLIVFVSSIWYRDKISYRGWLYIHYLSYITLGLVFLHAPKIGTFYNQYPYIQTLIFFMGFTFVINTLYRIASYFNFDKYEYLVKDIKEYGNDIYTITMSPKNKKISYKPGQYFYLKISKLFGEEHPYSLLEYKENGDLVFGIKTVGNFSKQVSKLKRDSTVFLEGPYGVFTLEAQNNLPKVIIAGGVGITPFYELIKNYSNEKTYLFYCNRKIEEAINIMEFKKLLQDRYFNVLSADKTEGETILSRRLDKEILRGTIPEKVLKKANIFICGSPTFINNLKETVKDSGIKEDHIFFEAFSL